MTDSSFSIDLPMATDMHIHLRQDAMCNTVTQLLKDTGIDTFLVMPNLIPPITTTDMALAYHQQLTRLAPDVSFLMTLYLSQDLTVEEIERAKRSGIVTGVKSYPKGVTTNSDQGIESYDAYDTIFRAMEQNDLMLHIHGECPCNEELDINVINAEHRFLDELPKLSAKFPGLRIVLEHVTTQRAVEMVKSLGPNVACTITIHHMYLTIQDCVGNPFGFCKPVPKLYSDRKALIEVVRERNPKFFLGTDSAPHPKHLKHSVTNPPAGLFTSMNPLIYLAHLFHQLDMLDCLHDFCCTFGRLFFKLDLDVCKTKPVRLTYHPQGDSEAAACTAIPNTVKIKGLLAENGDEVEVVPFLAGHRLPWTIQVQEHE